MKLEEYESMQEEVSNISVKNLATFWEDLSKQVQGELVRQESPSIRKKWNSMPELKTQVVKRKLPDATTQKKVRKIEEKGEEGKVDKENREIIKSNYIVNDVDLCRSVSIKDRREMFESFEMKTR